MTFYTYKWHISITKVRKNNITALLLHITLVIVSTTILTSEVLCITGIVRP